MTLRTTLRNMAIAATFASATALLAPAAHAADAAAGNIAVLNIQDIMRESEAGKSIKAQLEQKQKSFQSELSSKEEQLQKENQELGKQRSVLAKDAFEQKMREFNTKASEAQRDVQSKKSMLDRGFNQAVGEIQKTVNTILEEMAKEKGFALVIPTQQILYNDAKLDITKEVLDRLNKTLPKVTVNFSAPPAAAKDKEKDGKK